MTGEEIKSTYPEYTVYVHYFPNFPNEDISVLPWNHYADKGKTYKECSDALAKSTGFTERQDKDLYNLAVKIEKDKKSKVDISEFAERLRNISFDIDSLLKDCEE